MFKEELLLVELLTPSYKTAGILDGLPSPSDIISKIKELLSGSTSKISSILEGSKDPDTISHLVGEVVTSGALQSIISGLTGSSLLGWIFVLAPSLMGFNFYDEFLKIYDKIKGPVADKTLTEEHIEKAVNETVGAKTAFDKNLREIKLYKTAGAPLKIISILALVLGFICKSLFKGAIVTGAVKAKDAVFGPSEQSIEQQIQYVPAIKETGNNEHIGGEVLPIENTLDNIKTMLVKLTNDTYQGIPEDILRSSFLFNRVAKDIYRANYSYGDDKVSVIIPDTYPDQKSLVNIFMPEVVKLMKLKEKG